MIKENAAVLIRGSHDADYVDGYQPPFGSHFIEKTRNSAFLSTKLDEELSGLNVEMIVLCGVFIDGCVGLTAADAAQRDFDVTFLTDCIGHTNQDFRKPIFHWLVDDYSMKAIKVAQLS
ncbi:MAG: cysteine hydrolase [Hyphomicrobiales bacterium]|nr:cysteine hydrolase [Hyphomicrobiales bacterium]